MLEYNMLKTSLLNYLTVNFAVNIQLLCGVPWPSLTPAAFIHQLYLEYYMSRLPHIYEIGGTFFFSFTNVV